MTRRFWSHVENATLKRRYPHESTAMIAGDLGCPVCAVYNHAHVLGLRKSAAYLASPSACRLRRGDQVGARSRFPTGHVPANKGLRRPGWAPGRMKDTQFKPGERRGVAATNWRPVGTIATDHDGYQRIKVRDAHKGEATGFGNVRVWPLLQRYVWAQAHGAIPPGHAIVFRDGTRANCALDNLECITRRALMARNTVHNLPKSLALTIQALGALRRQLRRRDGCEKQN